MHLSSYLVVAELLMNADIFLSKLKTSNVSVNFVKQSANKIANCLARYSYFSMRNVHSKFIHVLINE